MTSSIVIIDLLEELTTLMCTYCIKYMNSLYRSSKNVKYFQKFLLGITKWDDRNIQKEYKKFLKWTNKRGVQNFETQLNIYINRKIYSLSKQSLDIDIDYIKTFHKCIKRIAKVYYKNPKDIFSISEKSLFKIIQNTIRSLIPLQKVFEIIQNKDNSSVHSYKIDYNNSINLSDTIDNYINSNDVDNIQLKYIPSDCIINEYYESSENSTDSLIKDIFFKKK